MVAPSTMHVTLRFIGEAGETLVPALQAALDASVEPFEIYLTLGRVTSLGPDARVSVVAIAVEGERYALAELAARLDGAVTSSLGVAPERRTFNPHLTLARMARGLDAPDRRAVAAAARELAPPPELPFTARQFLLVRSHLAPEGSRYETLSHHRGR